MIDGATVSVCPFPKGPSMKKTMKAMSGMTAAAQAAYALSEMAVIFPITPASHMAETVEKWASEGRKNFFDEALTVKEMQSEKGVAGTLHGCLAAGALGTTMTASQGLLLMIPNMYKISGEMLPGVFHVTCRSLATHALSIFGDHQDLMAVRSTGVGMLGSSSVQECQDLSWVAHLSAIEASLPIVHFFDGFRTSDEIQTIEVIDADDMRDLVNWDAVSAFRHRGMDPQHPEIRGTAQNPDIYFQNREAPNSAYEEFPSIVQKNMDAIAKVTGRQYRLFDYVGHPKAERVVVTMASSCETVEAVVNDLVAKGEKVGLVKVRLYRPFSAAHLLEAIPESVKFVCALDRTKEPGSFGEPLFLDVAAAVLSDRPQTKVIGGRYGLSSKEFSPKDAKAVFDNMAAKDMKTRFTVGINDDVTHLSLDVPDYRIQAGKNLTQAIFYGFGSDGTVSANKMAANIVSDKAGKCVQEYSWFDSKKSGGLTISYMRFGDEPIHAPWLIEEADYLACHKDIYVERGYDMLARLRTGGIFVLNTPWADIDSLNKHLPAEMRRSIAEKKARFYVIDAEALAAKEKLGPRINLIMQTVFFKLADVMDVNVAIDAMKEMLAIEYASKGKDVVAADQAAIDSAIGALIEIDYPKSWAYASAEALPPDADGQSCDFAGTDQRVPSQRIGTVAGLQSYIDDVFRPMDELRGNDLPVSAMNVAGFAPLGSAAFEKRRVAYEIPQWNLEKCIECYQCSFVCPHAAIRPYVATDDELKGAPNSYETKPATLKALQEMNFRIQVYPEDCVGCGSCADNCPGRALDMRLLQTQLDVQKMNLSFAQENISLKDDLVPATSVPGTQLQKPLLEFSSCCGGCGETPYVKLLTQMFGDRLIIANATGCSSIWGGYMPSIPYTVDMKGHGPAWGNSLFEDNAEYGYGIARAVKIKRDRLETMVKEAISGDGLFSKETCALLGDWLNAKDDAEASFDLGEAAQSALMSEEGSITGANARKLAETILGYGEMFAKKSVWAIGGDGWAYDIDFDGLDEVLASDQDINILVLDTEGYSNTGGEMSKATELSSVSGFSLDGKPTPRKELGRMMAQYHYVYVAQVCLGADMAQTIKALREAESFDGPSIVIALCPCISWGIKGGMSTNLRVAREGVKAGYWPLFRYDPRLYDEGKDPWVIDSKKPDGNLEDFLEKQDRFTSLGQREPGRADTLHSELAKDVAREFAELESFGRE